MLKTFLNFLRDDDYFILKNRRISNFELGIPGGLMVALKPFHNVLIPIKLTAPSHRSFNNNIRDA